MNRKYFIFILIIFISVNIFSNNAVNKYYLGEKLNDYLLTKQGIYSGIEINSQSNIVLYITYFRGDIISIDSVKSFDDYLRADEKTFIIKQLRKYTEKSIGNKYGSQGLIGDIDIPVTFGKLSSFLGEGSKLIVEGSERVEFNGSKTIDLNAVTVESRSNNWLPELRPFQHLIVSVTGTVGDRIEVNLHHNSQTDVESDNKVKLEYNAPEDDIIQTIEAGDINLSLPGIKLIGAPPQHKGLFGIKTSGQIGPVNFTAIASKETGESNSSSFTGNTKKDSLKLYDLEYTHNKFFYLGLSEGDSIIELHIYRDDGNGYNNEQDGAVYGIMEIYPGINDSVIYQGYFEELKVGENNDYLLGPGEQFIEIINSLGINEALGVSYIVKRADNTIDTVGTIDYQGDTLIIKALKISEDFAGSPTWDYMMKNVYSFNATNIVPESFSLIIKKENKSSGEDYEIENGKTYLNILGLDNNLDGIVDYNFVNFDRGYIIFPSSEPFNDADLEEPVEEIYNTSETGYEIGRVYYLEISYRGAQSVYSLGRMNILEGSEIVTVNGKVLERDKDYRIDYEYGIVTFLTDEVNSPSAEITIDYQFTPFLSLASKNLLGVHFDYEPNNKLSMNSNWLYKTLSYKLENYPQLGEEPQEILVGEIDLNYKEELPFITKLFNLFPFYYSDANSKFGLSGKSGFSFPNPNTTGKAFVEDMENVLNENKLSNDRRSWTFGSLIQGYDANNLSYNYYWYNDRELLGNINEQLPVQDRQTDVNIMKIVMQPNDTNPQNTFITLNQTISKTGIDLSDMRFVQVWVKGNEGKLTIDIGKNIPEDMLRRDANGNLSGLGELNTEDKNFDGILDYDEDTGLDGIAGTDGQNIAGDDGNDDYNYDIEHPNDYTKINGTENNKKLDTEDKNSDLRLNTESDLYRFTISLDSDENLIYEHPTSGWKLYRIPLNSSNVQIIGNPDLRYIKSARIQWEGIYSTDTLRIYEISMVSNRWSNFYTIGSEQEKFYVGAKNNQTDMDYESPFNPGYDLDGREKREQSIVLYCDSLYNNEGGKVFRFLSKKESFEKYNYLTFYARSVNTENLEFQLKFGGDSLNSYIIIVIPQTEWQKYVINLDSLVNLKRDNPDTNYYISGMYGYRGSPSLTNINYIELQVLNISNEITTDEIWVDDIMLIEPKKEQGMAGDISMSFNIPELYNMNVSYVYRDPFFHQLSNTKGAGNTSRTLNFSGTLNTDKFIPSTWGLLLPLGFSYNKRTTIPLYKIGSDYYLSENEIQENSSYSNTKALNMKIRKKTLSNNPIIRYTLDNISLNGNYTQSDGTTYNKIDSSLTYKANLNYAMNTNITPAKLFNRMNFYYFPSHINYSIGYSNQKAVVYTLNNNDYILTAQRIGEALNRNLTMSYKVFQSLSVQYTESKTNDPGLKGEKHLSYIGRDIGKKMNINLSYNPRFIKLISHNISLNSNYQDMTNYRTITVIDSTHITNISNNGRFSISGIIDYPYLLRSIAQLRDETKDSIAIKGSPPWLAIYLEQFANMFSPLSYSYSKSNNSSYSYIASRAPFEYQLSLTDSIPNTMFSDNTSVNKSSSYNMSLSSSMNIYNISLNSNYSKTSTSTQYMNNTTLNNNERWPNVSISINNLDRIFLINKFFRNFSMRSSYSKSINTGGVNEDEINRKTETENFSPFIGLNMTLKQNINIDYTYSITNNHSYNYGAIETERLNSSKNHNISIRYSFSKPSGINIPIINKKVHIKSNVNLTLTFNYTENYEYDITNSNELQNLIIYNINSRVDYNFSNNVTGGLNASFSKTSDKKGLTERMNISSGIWVLFKF